MPSRRLLVSTISALALLAVAVLGPEAAAQTTSGYNDDGTPADTNTAVPAPGAAEGVPGSSLTTTFASNNGQSGNSFDLRVLGRSGVKVESLDVNLDSGTRTVEVWTRPGTATGFDNAAAGWTSRGSATVVSAGQDNPTPLPVSFFLPPGNYGVIVALTDGSTAMNYTNGGPTTYEDGFLRIISRNGLADPVLTGAGVFVGRIWNGTIHYTPRPRPDARIKKGAAGPLVGNNTYNTTGLGQTRQGAAARGRRVVYYVSAQNDALFAERLRLVGGRSSRWFTVQYRNPANVNITRRVVTGAFRTPVLSPQSSYRIKVVVTVRRSAPRGASLTRMLSVRSDTNPTIRDNARFITRRR